MADVHDKATRSYNMSQIRSTNTKIEILFRQLLWENKLRGYRIKTKLPGKPDIYFIRAKLAIFIDGCFWHGCPKCYVQPKSNVKFWKNKINGNISRAKNINEILRKEGVKVIRFWDHDLKKSPQKCLNKVFKSLKINA